MRERTKRGMILAAVMLLVALGALTSVGVLFRSNAEQFTVSASGRSGRARAMARSGLAGVMREFENQRMDILRGEEPVLLEALTLEQADGRVGVARIVRVRQKAAIAEGAKININHVDEAVLAKLALVGPELASRIVAGRPFASVDELLRVEGVTPELLLGDLRAQIAEDESSESALVGDTASATALRDVLTVHGFWPAIQLGAGEDGERHAGERKINLNAEWSDDLGEAIAKRYSQEVAQGVKGVMERGIKFRGEGDIINVLVQIGVDPAEWAETLDSFCASDEAALAGRVDLRRAPAEVLAALPGMDESMARSVEIARDTVDRAELRTVAWPVKDATIRGETLAACIDSIAPSSAQWRVVIEAGFLARDADQSDEEAELESRVVLEAVIDLSTPRARLAELTDITNLGLTIAWRLENGEDEASPEGEPTDDDEGTLADEVPPPAPDEDDVVRDDSGEQGERTPTPPDRRIGRFRVEAGR